MKRIITIFIDAIFYIAFVGTIAILLFSCVLDELTVDLIVELSSLVCFVFIIRLFLLHEVEILSRIDEDIEKEMQDEVEQMLQEKQQEKEKEGDT